MNVMAETSDMVPSSTRMWWGATSTETSNMVHDPDIVLYRIGHGACYETNRLHRFADGTAKGGGTVPTVWSIIAISFVVTVDNALLSGLLLPRTDHVYKIRIMTTVGILLGLSQIVLAASVDSFMNSMLFRSIAIVLLSWMCIRTLSVQWRGRVGLLGAVFKTWIYTVVGNVDNMIWLGSELKGDRLALVITSIVTVPLFVLVSVFLSEQSDKQQWILPLGAGMMAWAAATLILDFPLLNTLILQLDDAPRTTVQALVTVLILLVGFGVRWVVLRRSLIRE